MEGMKTAEEYIDDFLMSSKPYNPSPFTKEDIKELIEQAQLDMLEYAVKKCSKNAEVTLQDCYMGQIEEGSSVEIGDYCAEINKQSILKIIDEIKKELNGRDISD